MLIKSSFDPKIEWAFPKGDVPYVPNEAPAGTEHTVLESECRKLWHFIKGADRQTPQFKKEQMFIQMLEGLQQEEAKVLLSAKDKNLHQMYKGLSKQVVKEAFNWNDDFMLNE
jgi:DNA topoisomerase VI subunit B